VTIHEVIEVLQAKNIYYTLSSHRDMVIMATAAVPGERWEIEVFPNGSVEMEIFKSDGEMYDAKNFLEKITEFVD